MENKTKIYSIIAYTIGGLFGLTALFYGMHYVSYTQSQETQLLKTWENIVHEDVEDLDGELAQISDTTAQLEYLNKFLRNMRSKKVGFSYVLNANQEIIATQYLHARKIQETIAPQKNLIYEIETQLKQQNAGSFTYDDHTTHSELRCIYAPLSSIDGTLCTVININDLTRDIDYQRQSRMIIIILCMCALVCIAIGSAFICIDQIHALWIIVALCSISLCIGLISLWYTTKLYPQYKENIVPIKDPIHLYTFLDTLQANTNIPLDTQPTVIDTLAYKVDTRDRLEALDNIFNQARYIPTGIQINHIQFIAEDQVTIAGYIWQRYLHPIHDHLTRGIILPQATTEVELTEIYRSSNKAYETIVWQVQATLNQQNSYTCYPFDIKDVQIQIRHAHLEEDIILIPDFDAYQYINRSAKPGVNQLLSVPGWYILGSYFGYSSLDQRTTFGLYDRKESGTLITTSNINNPTLNLDIVCQRSLINNIIDDLIPIIVSLLLLFVLILTSVQQKYDIMATSATLFFGMIVSEIRFRDKITSNELTYFESLYILMYVALLSILIVSLLYLLKSKMWVISYKENRIAKLLFMPSILILVIMITVYYLY